MTNRINNWTECDHFNLIPIWFISANMYIFWCQDCDIFLLRDYLEL
jgi:hypothetical protein